MNREIYRSALMQIIRNILRIHRPPALGVLRRGQMYRGGLTFSHVKAESTPHFRTHYYLNKCCGVFYVDERGRQAI